MKLFVKNNSGQIVYLDVVADTRQELAYKIGSYNFTINESNYTVNSVSAEADTSDFTGAATVGAGVGMLLGGPLGALLGGVIGGVFGNNISNEEIEKVNRFNSSKFTPNDTLLRSLQREREIETGAFDSLKNISKESTTIK